MTKAAVVIGISIFLLTTLAAYGQKCVGCNEAEKARSLLVATKDAKGLIYSIYRDRNVVVIVVDLPSKTANDRQLLNDRSAVLMLYTDLRAHWIKLACSSVMRRFLAAGVKFRVVWRGASDKVERFTTEATKADCV